MELMFMRLGFSMSREYKQIDKQVFSDPHDYYSDRLASREFFLGTDDCHLFHLTLLLTRRSQHREI